MTVKGLDAVAAIVIVFISLALYNFLELNILVISTFKRRSGLYFWSFIISTWGIAFNAIGYLLKHLGLISKAHVYATIILIGWCTMITGQSVVLYSRLHIVMRNKRRLRSVLIMIITNAIWLHIPIIVLVYGVNSSNPDSYVRPYTIYEKIQLSVFFLQEVTISGLYVWETVKLLKMERCIGNSGTIQLMQHLISVNTFIIVLDFSILGLEFADLYEIQTSWKPLVYSIKLKLEFTILDRLVHLTKNTRAGASHSNHATARQSHGLELNILHQNQTHYNQFAENGGPQSRYEVHIGSGGNKNTSSLPTQDISVVRTTEVQVENLSRQGNSIGSLAESGEKILTDLPTSYE